MSVELLPFLVLVFFWIPLTDALARVADWLLGTRTAYAGASGGRCIDRSLVGRARRQSSRPRSCPSRRGVGIYGRGTNDRRITGGP